MRKNKKNFFMLMLALLVSLPAIFSACAEGVLISGISPLDAYDEMVAAFQLENYDKAKEILDEHQLAQINLNDSKNYQLYIDALDYLDAGNYAVAASIFEGLSVDGSKFYNSEQLFYYCSGRAAEAAHDYELAIEYYTASRAYNDAAQRIAECFAKLKESTIERANELYQQGIAQKDPSLLKEAWNLYVSLEKQSEADQCLMQIQKIENQKAYDAAMQQYENGIKDNNTDLLEAAAAQFLALSNFNNSEEMYRKTQNAIANILRTLTLSVLKKDERSITFQWQDSLNEGTYLFSFRQKNESEAHSISLSQQEYTLNNLLPNTTYIIDLTIQGLQQPHAAVEVTTDKSASVQIAGFTVSRSSVIGIKRSHLSIVPLEDLLMNKHNALTVYDSKMITLDNIDASAQSLVYCYTFSYRQKDAIEQEITAQWILRTKNHGVYASEEIIHPSLGNSGTFYYDLSQLLNALYSSQKCWPDDPCTIELYINQQLAASGSLTINS